MVKVFSFRRSASKDRRITPAIFAAHIISIVLVLAGAGLGGYWLWDRFYDDNNQMTVPYSQTKITLAESGTNIPEPTNLYIPSLDIRAPFIKLGLALDKSLEVPKGGTEVGWFIHGAKPGQVGPAVVVGHKDTEQGEAVFAKLNQIKIGELIEITRADGSTVKYQVESVSQYSQDNFPTDAVYGEVDHAALRLITCAGTYVAQRDRYTDNFIVFARLVES
jgi:sortase (surface protein transpeptidase)